MSATWNVDESRTYAVDVDALRRDFEVDLDEDGIDLDDSEAVAQRCWDEGVREPYFTGGDDADNETCYITFPREGAA